MRREPTRGSFGFSPHEIRSPMRKEWLNSCEDLFVIRDFLSPAECTEQIARSEAIGFGDAPINGLAGPVINKRMRNNERVMIDDHGLATSLWERLRAFVPAQRGLRWKAVGVNERFRYYRYDPGQRFHWHYDGAFERSPREVSALTVLVYLNEGFDGGQTEFQFLAGGGSDESGEITVVPVAGMALVFVHGILHQGAAVARGRKYVLRTDVMYRYGDA